jgi:hypothetical protein
MAEFQVGDPVRVLGLPATASDTGRRGTVVRVSREDLAFGEVLLTYQVRLSDMAAGCVTFRPGELGVEASGMP